MADAQPTVRVYKAAHAIEAHLLRGLLEQAGIDVFIVGEHQNRAYGAFSHLFAIEIRVPAANEAAARAVVAQYEANAAETSDAPAWTCAACGESNAVSFESCWKCGSAHAPTGEVNA